MCIRDYKTKPDLSLSSTYVIKLSWLFNQFVLKSEKASVETTNTDKLLKNNSFAKPWIERNSVVPQVTRIISPNGIRYALSESLQALEFVMKSIVPLCSLKVSLLVAIPFQLYPHRFQLSRWLFKNLTRR